MEPSDAELILAARGGDVQSLATLLTRHRAAMHAVAVAVLGGRPDAEDVVQDASLVAVTDLDRLRDPSLARAWLTGITRNLARAQARRREPLPTDLAAVRGGDEPERRIEEAALRDWVWEAISGLSEPLRDVVVLRYFSRETSYGAIAAALGIPVGTVRSRLHDARTALVPRLRELEYAAIGDHGQMRRDRERLFAAIVDEYNSGNALNLLAGALADGARLTAAAGEAPIFGRAAITRGLAEDVDAGVRLRLLRVVSGAELTVVEGAFQNPPDAPDHCPPLTTQVYKHRGAEIVSLHLAYAPA